jgi:diaminohydroxyphosphoribosylaminopyrimidine deaminase / 5-amino-6-(5-phosphoribosylamino)uracil reductase
MMSHDSTNPPTGNPLTGESHTAPTTRRLDITGVTLKVAVDAQGAAADMSSDKSERFTCPEALDMVHRLRRDCDAVLVGKTTVVADNPSLLVRRVSLYANEQPVRVILDPTLSLLQPNSPSYTIFTDGYATIVYHLSNAILPDGVNLPDTITLVPLPPDSDNTRSLSVADVVCDLQEQQGIRHVMVEGGPRTALLFLQAGLVDRAIMVHADSICFRQPLLAGLNESVLTTAGLERLSEAPCGVDRLVYWSRPGVSWPTDPVSDWP